MSRRPARRVDASPNDAFDGSASSITLSGELARAPEDSAETCKYVETSGKGQSSVTDSIYAHLLGRLVYSACVSLAGASWEPWEGGDACAGTWD